MEKFIIQQLMTTVDTMRFSKLLNSWVKILFGKKLWVVLQTQKVIEERDQVTQVWIERS